MLNARVSDPYPTCGVVLFVCDGADRPKGWWCLLFVLAETKFSLLCRLCWGSSCSLPDLWDFNVCLFLLSAIEQLRHVPHRHLVSALSWYGRYVADPYVTQTLVHNCTITQHQASRGVRYPDIADMLRTPMYLYVSLEAWCCVIVQVCTKVCLTFSWLLIRKQIETVFDSWCFACRCIDCVFPCVFPCVFLCVFPCVCGASRVDASTFFLKKTLTASHTNTNTTLAH